MTAELTRLDVEPRNESEDRPGVRPSVRRRPIPWLVVATVSGVVALLAALAMPLAPVRVNDPVVNWPAGAVRSTALELTAYLPRSIDVRFDCTALHADTAGGTTILATIRPGEPNASAGLLITEDAGRLSVVTAGRTLYAGPIPDGSCRFEVVGDDGGVRLLRDGVRIGTAGRLPQVDALLTDVGPGLNASNLSATIRVNDQFATSPAPAKQAVMVVLILAVLLTLFALWRLDRVRRGRSPLGSLTTRLRPRLTNLLDGVVVAVIGWWMFVGPVTSDDGYYAAMAKNVRFEGYVAQYYQAYNQDFAPFSWWYYLLAKWQQVAGTSLLMERIPAAFAGVVMWLTIRWYLAGRLSAARRRTWAVAVAALSFLAWFLAYDLGVRPEPFVAAPLGVVLVLMTLAAERGLLLPVGLAFVFASVGFTAHPSGFVVLAPLIALAPRVWRDALRAPSRWVSAGRTLAVLAPGAMVSFIAFVDSGIYGFVRSEQIFLDVAQQDNWTQEWKRYYYLLDNAANTMNAYAKRVVVVVAFLALGWLLVLAGSRTIRRRIDSRAWVAATSLALGFLLLWPTPSKWTHHFGSLAVLGPLTVAILLTHALPIAGRLRRDVRLPWQLPVGGVLSFALVAALGMQGSNSWPPAWWSTLPHAIYSPYLTRSFSLGSVVLWLLIAVVCLLVAALRFRGDTGGRPWRVTATGLSAAILTLLAVDTAYLVGDFSAAGLLNLHHWTPYSTLLRDPLQMTSCSAGGATRVTDPRSAAVLEPVAGSRASSSPTFAADRGWYPDDPPPFDPGVPSRPPVWGSFAANAATPEASIGTMTTGWYRLPASGSANRTLTVMVAGLLGNGNSLKAQFAAPGGTVVREQTLDDGASSPVWRTVRLPVQQAGAEVSEVRLVARDGTTATGGWLAFSAPNAQPVVSVTRLTGDAATGVSWQFASYFPCQRQFRQQDGINEPIEYAVLQGHPNLDAWKDATLMRSRGAPFGRMLTSGQVTQLLTTVPDVPALTGRLEVYLVGHSFAADAYSLTVGEQTVFGFTGPAPQPLVPCNPVGRPNTQLPATGPKAGCSPR